jgi:hypothetical protein
MNGKAEGPSQRHKKGSDGCIRMVMESKATFTDRKVGKEPRQRQDWFCSVGEVVKEKLGCLVDG